MKETIGRHDSDRETEATEGRGVTRMESLRLATAEVSNGGRDKLNCTTDMDMSPRLQARLQDG